MIKFCELDEGPCYYYAMRLPGILNIQICKRERGDDNLNQRTPQPLIFSHYIQCCSCLDDPVMKIQIFSQ